MDRAEKELAEVWQVVGQAQATAKAGHARLDNLEKQTREDFKEIQVALQKLLNMVSDIRIERAKDKGFQLGVIAVVSILSAGLGSVLPIVISWLSR